ncbi:MULTISPECIES: anti-phage protein KwaA [Xanthomonas]|uniref:anti-phage protein KwaA n=1 Tax=Xanthomonas TaxID=338 RepID=UPI0009E9288D|nr:MULTISPECIES: anti-phage protein KwaA [Xanthomonas]
MRWLKAELYVASLWLLFVLAIVLAIDIPLCTGEDCNFVGWKEIIGNNKIALSSALLMLSGMVSIIRFNHLTRRGGDLPREVLKAEDVNYEHLTFLTTYIIPIISFNLSSSRYVVCVGILLTIIGVIYIKTDRFYSNPTLAVLGFRLYKLKFDGSDEDFVVITRSRIKVKDLVCLKLIDDRVAIASRSK